VVNKKKELVGILTKKDFVRRFLKFDEHKVKDHMTKNPDFVSTSTRLIEARDKLIKLNISVLPVYEGGAVVGLISKKLIAIALATFRDEVPGKRISERIRTLQVGDHMLNDPPTITSGKSLADAAQLLVKEYIHAVPVVDQKGHLIAILTRGDLVKVVAGWAKK
jgi:CBS domain-containing protein